MTVIAPAVPGDMSMISEMRTITGNTHSATSVLPMNMLTAASVPTHSVETRVLSAVIPKALVAVEAVEAAPLPATTTEPIQSGQAVTGMNTATTAMSFWIMVPPMAPTPTEAGATTVPRSTVDITPVLIAEKVPTSMAAILPQTSMLPTVIPSTVLPNTVPPVHPMWVQPPIQVIL